MSNQPPYGNPPGGGYPPPPGGGYPPPPPGGGYPPPGPPSGKTQMMQLDYKVAGLLCYLPVCCIQVIAPILWLATEPKENRFLRFHSIQSLLLFGVTVVVTIILWVLQGFLSVASSATNSGGIACGGGLIILLLWSVVGIGLLVLYIMGMVKAYQNQMWKMPVIGNIAEKNS